MSAEWLTPLSILSSAFSLLMFFTWILSLRMRFLSFVDAVWASGIGIAALYLGLTLHQQSMPRSLLFISFVTIWSIRLSWHLSSRVGSHYPNDDKRYEKLKISWKQGYIWKTFLFFQSQAVTQLVLSLPILIILSNQHPFPRPLEILGSVLASIGIVGEWLADRQLKTFKANPANSGQVCNYGLWRYSRHPNYFFEWLFWCGMAVAAFRSPDGWVAVLAPVLMFVLLFFVTGVKPSEEQSVLSKGDLYERYKQETNTFFPWFRRRIDR